MVLMRTVLHDAFDYARDKVNQFVSDAKDRVHSLRNKLSIKVYFLRHSLRYSVSVAREKLSSLSDRFRPDGLIDFVSYHARLNYGLLKYFASLTTEFAIYGLLLTYAAHTIANTIFGYALPVYDYQIWAAYGIGYYFLKLEVPEFVNSIRRR